MFSQTNTNKSSVQLSEQILQSTKVLIAEDNRINQMIAERAFQEVGVDKQNITVVPNGQLAVDYVRQHHDGASRLVIYMDHHMPVMMGDVAIAAIRELEANKGLKPSYIFTCSDSVAAKLNGSDTSVDKQFSVELAQQVLKDAHDQKRHKGPNIRMN